MRLLQSLEELSDVGRGGALTIGNFDGVHRGHANIITRLRERAAAVGGPALVFTFDPHPVRLLRPDEVPPPLTWTDRKAELLAGLGVDTMIAYPTDMALLKLTAAEFFQRIVCELLDAKAIVEGPNFCFGRDRQGDVAALAELAEEAGISLDIVDALVVDGETVSSSRIRRSIATGDVDTARRLLTEPYRIRGMVTHGVGRGHEIGFPTANLEAIDTLLPGEGVYAGWGYHDNQRSVAAINIGANPTFGEGQLKVEIHLVGWQKPLYGRPLEVDFLARLRDVQRFESVEQLVAQLTADVAQAETIAAAAIAAEQEA
ncbi:MAG: bifunctional riboflavin kinase/FAD synthetase [Planctomycetota bacterium]|nr:MAG: bifunctional riboflavin kinase/FAD synthetase [Planctomycetota bacterium]REJ92318.1 MAG: bifunctional riboflavin kinase/FAD synthetase [Planctomycetota bacterium]REK30259.1 MAG: bifunctional riboflavin kinase/FAD synthetase [Planctomycetota bacterium]REK43451.1 MAG: bifunctional riboflavin kinase/FAD synthetase [Planctomycetota bacterium]